MDLANTASPGPGPGVACSLHPAPATPIKLARKSTGLGPSRGSVETLSWLLGTWQGKGKGEYPTLSKNFSYMEEIVLSLDPNNPRPVLQYRQRSWSMSSPSKPMHVESGWVRVLSQVTEQGHPRVEVILSAQNGVNTVEEGYVREHALHLHSTSITRSSTARAPHATEFHRRFEVDLSQDPPVLHYTMDMATTTTSAVTRHLEAWLVKQPPPPATHEHHHHHAHASMAEVHSSNGTVHPFRSSSPCLLHAFRSNSSFGSMAGGVHSSPHTSGTLPASACPFANGHAQSPLGSPLQAALGMGLQGSHHSMSGMMSTGSSFNSRRPSYQHESVNGETTAGLLSHAIDVHPEAARQLAYPPAEAASGARHTSPLANGTLANGVHHSPHDPPATHMALQRSQDMGLPPMPPAHCNGYVHAHEAGRSALSRQASYGHGMPPRCFSGTLSQVVAPPSGHTALVPTAAAVAAPAIASAACPMASAPMTAAAPAAVMSPMQQVAYSSAVPCSLDAALGRLAIDDTSAGAQNSTSLNLTM